MLNPRQSDDPLVRRMLGVWEQTRVYSERTFGEALTLHDTVQSNGSWQAIGWSSLICGRIAACRGDLNTAERFLIEAAGQLHFACDRYGQALVDSQIAVILAQRGQTSRALKFALASFVADIQFSESDRLLLHGNAASCHWRAGEFHETVGHLLSQHELALKTGIGDAHAPILANLGAVLLAIGDFELSLSASRQSLSLLAPTPARPNISHATILANILFANHLLGRRGEALKQARVLFELLKTSNEPCHWMPCLATVGAFAAAGQTASAQAALAKARTLSCALSVAATDPNLLIAEAAILEAQQECAKARTVVRQVLELPARETPKCTQVEAALIYLRSSETLGDKSEAKRWRKYVNDFGKPDLLLNNILAGRLRTNFSADWVKGTLTAQEASCLSLSARGQSSADIGQKLGIKPRTVNFHFSKILRKLNATNRQEAIAIAVRANLIDFPSAAQSEISL